jgi:hypothetical protein
VRVQQWLAVRPPAIWVLIAELVICRLSKFVENLILDKFLQGRCGTGTPFAGADHHRRRERSQAHRRARDAEQVALLNVVDGCLLIASCADRPSRRRYRRPTACTCRAGPNLDGMPLYARRGELSRSMAIFAFRRNRSSWWGVFPVICFFASLLCGNRSLLIFTGRFAGNPHGCWSC